MADTTPRKQLNPSVFWHIILPILSLLLLLCLLYVLFTMPDVALTCSSDLESVRRLSQRVL